MKEIEIIIDGVKFAARPVKTEERPQTGYERMANGKDYRYIADGIICVSSEFFDNIDNRRYYRGNYYSDKTIAENNVLADTLLQRLRRWQALNDKPVDWSDGNMAKWVIEFEPLDNTIISTDTYNLKRCGAVYFSTEKKAEEAIAIFRDELMWYFTEYQSRVDEPRKEFKNE